jgi:hypothetical protein
VGGLVNRTLAEWGSLSCCADWIAPPPHETPGHTFFLRSSAWHLLIVKGATIRGDIQGQLLGELRD